jgi:dCMP deaminase
VRISWEEYALNIAETVSSRSEDPYAKVGACALNTEHMVVAVGYNGLASGKDVTYDFWRNRDYRRKFMVHAEVNCLSLFKKREAEMLAVTLLPCSSCATMIAGYGIPKVIYRDVYKRDERALEIFEFYNIECMQYGN